jgi:hypothetical protein
MSDILDQSRQAPVPPFVWPATLACATIVGTLAIACMMPFVGLAVVAAATMPMRRAATTVAGAWLVNQLTGFTLLGFPLAGYTLSWGVAIGGASMAALFVARTALNAGTYPVLARLIMAFGLAFVSYEFLLFIFAGFAGGRDTFTPAIVFQIALNDGVWLAALMLFRLTLVRTAPNWFGATPTLGFA